MPHTKSCAKRMRTSTSANARNRAGRTRLRNAVKKVMATRKKEDGERELRSATGIVDKSVKHKILHRNNAAHTKSRLARHVNGLGS